MKKILIFSTAYLPFIGGAEIAIKEITDRIGDIQFDLVTLRFNSNLPKFQRLGNVNIYRIGFTGNNPAMSDLVKFPLAVNKLFFPFTACFKACRLQRKNSYDGIWAMMAAYAGFAAMFFKICHPKMPYLLTLQEGDPIEYIKRKVRFVYPLFKRIFTKADFIQVISSYLADFARSMGYKGELEVVPNGVDIKNYLSHSARPGWEELRKELGIKDDEKILITISRLVKKNAVNNIIKALEYLPANFKFFILGDGPDRKMLEYLVKELKLANRVFFLGGVAHEELPRYLAIADIFIRPSLSEGQGIAFLEAMAAGVPIIATPVGGIVDFLVDGETGLFCEVHNPKSIAEKVKIYLTNPVLTEKIKINARALVTKNYSWDLIAEAMERILKKIMI